MSEGEVLTHAPRITLIELEDSDILCIDCDETFVWTAGEQTFFRNKNLQNPPKRCKDCKKAKNKRLQAVDLAKSLGIRQRVEVKAKCAKCETMTTVPFYPSQGRPVYCRPCFLESTAISTSSGTGI